MIDDVRPVKRSAKSLTRPPLPQKPTASPENQTIPQVIEAPEPAVATPDPPEPKTAPLDMSLDTTATPKRRRKLRFFSWSPSKREGIALAVLVILLGTGSSFALLHQPSPAPPTVVAPKKKVVVATTVPSTLSGLPVNPSVNQTPVTGVMIENSTFARPQSGLGQAGVVFEAIAEGGVTRFLALFQDTSPDNVGPIRSARPYYVQWALGFDAGYAHVGGSPEALADIKSWGVRDLDQFFNSGAYHRISSRAAPHNVYTGIPTLNQLEASKGYNSSNYTGFVRKAKEEPSKAPTATKINFSISGPDYSVHYDYAAATNSYNRSVGGAAHTDSNTGAVISPKVVIGLVMPYKLEADGYHSDYSTIGSGTAYVFQDGLVTQGTWTKSAANSQFTFTDANGKTIGLNRGQTWLTALADTGKVTYTP